jgi:GH18 family chitinase
MCLCFFSQAAFAQKYSNKKIVGYVPSYKTATNVDYRNLTHSIYAFINTTAAGKLKPMIGIPKTNFRTFLDSTEGKETIRMVALGSDLKNLSTNITAIRNLSDTIVKFCKIYNIQGVDIDWEALSTPEERSNYTILMDTISDRLHKNGLLLSATVGFGDYWSQWFENKALERADWIQIMVYDLTGTWPQSPFGNHSTFEHFKQADEYWVNRGFKRDKIVLGVPFYGYKFKDTDGGLATPVTYNDIIGLYPTIKDSANVTPGDDLTFFNGPDLIRQKCNYILDSNLAGVMIWEMTQDAPAKKSLHKQIVCAFNKTSCIDSTIKCSQKNSSFLVTDINFNLSDKDSVYQLNPILNTAKPDYDRFGNENYAYRFEKNSRIDYGNVLSSIRNFSISMWAKTTIEPNGFQTLISKYNSDSTLAFELSLNWNHPEINIGGADHKTTTYFFTPAQLVPDNWYHITMTHSDSLGTKIYINSLLAGENREVIKANLSNDNLVIGNVGNIKKDNQFYGSLDDIKIFNTVLNQCDIDSLFYPNYSNMRIVGIADDALLGTSKIYPNPASAFMTITIDQHASEVVILNHLGNHLQTIVLDKGNHKIDVSHLHNGIYHIHIKNAVQSFYQKLIIQK